MSQALTKRTALFPSSDDFFKPNYNSFSRSFNLPDGIRKDKIEAKYEDGVLKVKLPKSEEAVKNGKSVQISVD